jgi:hypothetical protein
MAAQVGEQQVTDGVAAARIPHASPHGLHADGGNVFDGVIE